jgi:hypothetical protein
VVAGSRIKLINVVAMIENAFTALRDKTTTGAVTAAKMRTGALSRVAVPVALTVNKRIGDKMMVITEDAVTCNTL